jgi:hypothetical protein
MLRKCPVEAQLVQLSPEGIARLLGIGSGNNALDHKKKHILMTFNYSIE